ncbi:hypothetical protein APHAL10511_008476 [Amanita phalloides]|nr:hypothetical protein APHAL10511_008476 [Amanita phalloides]
MRPLKSIERCPSYLISLSFPRESGYPPIPPGKFQVPIGQICSDPFSISSTFRETTTLVPRLFIQLNGSMLNHY